MKKEYLIISFVILTFSPFFSFSQEKEIVNFPKNVLHISGSGIILIVESHLSYDRLIKTTDKGLFNAYYVTAKIGGISFFSTDPDDEYFGGFTPILPLGFIGSTGLRGKKDDFFEFGLGVGLYNSGDNNLSFFPSGNIGYRRQSEKKIVYRFGIGIPEIIYGSIGFRF